MLPEPALPAAATLADNMRNASCLAPCRLSAARILIIGCTGLAAEVSKNIVLAGVGSVTLVDDTPCSARPPSNFLVPADAAATSTCV